jgi:hypothetical protein
MSNFDTVVLDGEMGLFTKVREGDLPYYTGATEVTPSDSTQVLETADTIVTENITINPIPDMDLEEVQVTYTPDEEGQTDTITPSTGYVGIAEVEVTVEPIDSDYVGSGIARNDSDDLTASGATVTVPAGYYENSATKTLASGTEGTPTATKGTVINHSVAVTPSVTNTEGYISGGTHTGTAVTVSASELVSGSQNITSNDTYDVTNLASVTVAVPGETPTLQTKSVSYTPTESAQSSTVTADQGYDGLDEVNISVGAISSSYVGSAIDRRDSTDLSASGATVTAPAGYYANSATKSVASGTAGTPSATKGAVSNHSVSVTPSVTNTAGYISGGTISGTAVSVSASELVSGTLSITAPGTFNVENYASVEVDIDMWTEQTISTSGAVTQALDPYVLYHFTGSLTSLTVTLGQASGIACYHFDFDCGSTAPTVTIPNTVTMPDSQTFDASNHYEVDILNNYGAVLSWAIS